mgnify:FL=1
MDYNHITSFLEKFKNLISKEELYSETISNIIEKEISYKIDKNTIKIKRNVIFINGSPVLRNEILINKSKILQALKEGLPGISFSDIR